MSRLLTVYGQPVRDLANAVVVSPSEAKRLRGERLREINRRRKRQKVWDDECLAGKHGPWLQEVAQRRLAA